MAPSTIAISASLLARANDDATDPSPVSQASRLRAGRPLTAVRCAESIKSGPLFAATTFRPRLRSAPTIPRASVVLPTSLDAPAKITRGTLAVWSAGRGARFVDRVSDAMVIDGSLPREEFPRTRSSRSPGSRIVPSTLPSHLTRDNGLCFRRRSPHTVARPRRLVSRLPMRCYPIFLSLAPTSRSSVAFLRLAWKKQGPVPRLIKSEGLASRNPV
jgi:hypothetical protein